MSTDLAGRTALITGAGRGIGAEIARGLARAGAHITLVARSADELAATAATITGTAGARVRTVVADLADDGQRERAAGYAGHVDVLINNAATVEPLGASTGVGVGELRRAFDTNVVAVAALTAALVPGMVEAGWGSVVNVSSSIVASPGSMVGANAYTATKAALEAHTRNLAAELAGTGVTVNVYRPGGVDTAMQARIRDQDPVGVVVPLRDRFRRRHAAGELITPAESAAALLGHLLGPDGARTGAIWNLSETVAV
jgi:short-subunit dehydrogenase